MAQFALHLAMANGMSDPDKASSAALTEWRAASTSPQAARSVAFMLLSIARALGSSSARAIAWPTSETASR